MSSAEAAMADGHGNDAQEEMIQQQVSCLEVSAETLILPVTASGRPHLNEDEGAQGLSLSISIFEDDSQHEGDGVKGDCLSSERSLGDDGCDLCNLKIGTRLPSHDSATCCNHGGDSRSSDDRDDDKICKGQPDHFYHYCGKRSHDVLGTIAAECNTVDGSAASSVVSKGSYRDDTGGRDNVSPAGNLLLRGPVLAVSVTLGLTMLSVEGACHVFKWTWKYAQWWMGGLRGIMCL
jgi:hypothetical protein